MQACVSKVPRRLDHERSPECVAKTTKINYLWPICKHGRLTWIAIMTYAPNPETEVLWTSRTTAQSPYTAVTSTKCLDSLGFQENATSTSRRQTAPQRPKTSTAPPLPAAAPAAWWHSISACGMAVSPQCTVCCRSCGYVLRPLCEDFVFECTCQAHTNEQMTPANLQSEAQTLNHAQHCATRIEYFCNCLTSFVIHPQIQQPHWKVLHMHQQHGVLNH